MMIMMILSYQHGEPLVPGPNHVVRHAGLVSSKERSPELLELGVNIPELGHQRLPLAPPLLGRGGEVGELVKEGNKLAELLHKQAPLGLRDWVLCMELLLRKLLRQEMFQLIFYN